MTNSVKNKKWTDETVATLLSIVGSSGVVTAAAVAQASETLSVSVRSVASKLRQLGREVASLAKVDAPTFSESATANLQDFVVANSGQFTYKDIAAQFEGGQYSPKQIQGKLLALELTKHVKPAEKIEAARTYTAAEEAKFIELANAGSFIEDIATALGKELPSVRGKALSLSRTGAISSIPKQKASHAAVTQDPLDALGSSISDMTVAEIAKATDRTERGIRTALTRRGITVKDYKGADKRAKADQAKLAA